MRKMLSTRTAVLLWSALSCLAMGPARAALGSGDTITIPSLGARFKQTDERIAALFQYRNGTMPKLDPKLNPFRLPDAPTTVETVSNGKTEAAQPQETDEKVLHLGAATLKVNGIVMIGGRALLTINQGTYKEGDVIVARVHGRATFLRIKKINSHSAILTLNEAELELRF